MFGTITGSKLDRLGANLDKQVAVTNLVLSSFFLKLISTNYLDSCQRYVPLSNLVTGRVLSRRFITLRIRSGDHSALCTCTATIGNQDLVLIT